MKIICYYNKNLKMSSGKLASQVGHVCKEIGKTDYLSFCQSKPNSDVIIVLGLRKSKFEQKLIEITENPDLTSYVQVDLGHTEVKPGTKTVFGYIEPKPEKIQYYLPIWNKSGNRMIELRMCTKEEWDILYNKVKEDSNYKIREDE